jgi:hypothetical protein
MLKGILVIANLKTNILDFSTTKSNRHNKAHNIGKYKSPFDIMKADKEG